MVEPAPNSVPQTAPQSPPWWILPPDFWRAFGVLVAVAVPLLLWLVQSAVSSHGERLPTLDLPEVRLHFAGQEAVLTGRVLDDEQSAAASADAAERIRVGPRWWTGALNPIARVRNEIVVRPNPPGFILVIRERAHSLLAGQTYTNTQQDELLRELTSVLPPKPDTLLLHTAAERGPSGRLALTIDSLKSQLSAHPTQTPIFLAATLGTPAQQLDLGTDNATLEKKFNQEGWDWEHSQAVVEQLRGWVVDAAEYDRRMALPPPHLVLLAAGNEVFLRGKVATQTMLDRILNAARLFYGEERLRAQVELTEDRRPNPDAGATVISFPALPNPTTSGVLAFAEPGQPWRSTELPEEGFTAETLECLEILPDEFPRSLIREDLAQLIGQHDLHRAALADMALKATYPVAYSALLLVGNHAYLHGELASEELRAEMITAAKQAYPDLTLLEELHFNDKRRPLTPEQAAHFTTGWPAQPLATSPGVMAFIVPGRTWQQVKIPPVELRPEEFDEFVHFHLIPSSFPTDDAQPIFTGFRSIVTEHFKNTSSMKLSQVPPEPYLTFLAVGKQIFLRGNAGSAQLKKTVLEAARKTYRNYEIVDEMRIDSQPPIILPAGLTIKTFPPPVVINSPAVLGFNRPGQPWLQLPLPSDHPVITLEWLETRGLFSKDFDAKRAWPDYEAWLPKLPAK